LVVLAEVPFSQWEEEETRYIRAARALGMDLVNATDGGEGGIGTKHSLESREKISKAKKGKPLSEEHKKNLSLARSGRIITRETKNKLCEAMKTRKRDLISGRFL